MKIEVRAGNAVHIEGYVNAVERDSHIITVPSIGQCVEQIRAGVFDKALRAASDVMMLENHDETRKLGSISEGNLKLYEDNIGLRAIADIVDADIADKARRKMLKGWSFGFICTDSEIEQRAGNVPRRIVKGMMLSEVSLIDGAYKPCYNGTLVEVRSEGDIIEYRGGIDETVEVNTPTDNSDTPTENSNSPTENSNSTTENSNSTTVDETVETRSEEPDYSYYDAMLKYLELRYNPYHDDKGRFCSGGGGGGGVTYVPNKKKGEKGMSGDGSSFYIGMSDRDSAEQALANEFEKWIKSKNAVPDAIQAKVSKVKEMTKKSPFGELQGDIKVTKDENGNYNLSYTQVKKYGELQSATIGVGDIPARKETTHTTYVLDNKGRRINTIRKTETEYGKPTTAASDDWTGANANMGTSSSAKRKMSSAMKWADMQTGHRAEEDTDDETVETRSEEPDYSYYDAMLRYLELRYNPYHDDKGRFCSGGGGGGGGVLVVPKGQKGKGFYVGASDRDFAEQALATEYEEWKKVRQNAQGGQTAEESERIKNELVDSVNPKFVGLKREAVNGEKHWAWTKGRALSENEAQEMEINKVYDKGKYSVVSGGIGNEIVYFAADSSNPTIAKAKAIVAERKVKSMERFERDRKKGLETLYDRHTTGTTTTYDRWRSNNLKKFDEYWNGAQGNSRAEVDDDSADPV